MPLGRSQGRLRPEVPRFDELPDGVPAPSRSADAGAADAGADVQRTPEGHPADARSAAELGRRGGLAAAERRRQRAEVPSLARGLGLREVSAEALAPYLSDADALAESECARLAQVVGGGHCGTAPSLIVATAALQIAGSRYAFARGDIVTGSRLGDAARANLLSAHELCAKEAKARQEQQETDDGRGVFA